MKVAQESLILNFILMMSKDAILHNFLIIFLNKKFDNENSI